MRRLSARDEGLKTRSKRMLDYLQLSDRQAYADSLILTVFHKTHSGSYALYYHQLISTHLDFEHHSEANMVCAHSVLCMILFRAIMGNAYGCALNTANLASNMR